jgi:hypothetical protein
VGCIGLQSDPSKTAETTALIRALACFEKAELRGLQYRDNLAYLFLPEDRMTKIDDQTFRDVAKSRIESTLFWYIRC